MELGNIQPTHNAEVLVFAKDCEKAKNCVECGMCEAACPQALKIREDLKRAQEDLDNKRI